MKITKSQLKQIIKEELLSEAQRPKQKAHDARARIQKAQRAKKEQEAEEIRNVLGTEYEVHVRMLEGRYQLTVNKVYTGAEEY